MPKRGHSYVYHISYCSHNWVSVEGLYSSLLVAASESATPVAIIKLMVTFDVHAFL